MLSYGEPLEITTPLLALLGLAVHDPPPVGQKKTWAGFAALRDQKPVPSIVTVLPPVTEPPVTEPESPATTGVTAL
jgi:hypothetical protein